MVGNISALEDLDHEVEIDYISEMCNIPSAKESIVQLVQ